MENEWEDGWNEYEDLVGALKGCFDTHKRNNKPSNHISQLLFDAQEGALTQAENNAKTWKCFTQSYQDIITGLSDEKGYLCEFKSSLEARRSTLPSGSVEKLFNDEWVQFIGEEITLLDDLKTELERLIKIRM